MIRTITIREVWCETCPRTLKVIKLENLPHVLETHGWAVIDGKHVCKECLKKRAVPA